MENKKSSKSTKKSSSSKKNSTSTKSTTKKSTTSVSAKKNVTATKTNVELKKIREEEKPKVDIIKVNKNKEKSIKNFEFMKFVLYAFGIFLIVLGVLFNNTLLETEVLGLVLGDFVIPVKLIGFLIIGVTGVIQSIKSESHSLLKSLLVILGMSILGAWIFPNGYLSGSTFVDAGTYGIAINDFISLAYNGIYMCIDKILILIFIGIFYKLCEATGAYHKIIDKISKKLKGNEKNAAIGSAIIVILLMTFVTEIYAVLFFLPFLISILVKLNIDKITAFAVTFGALIAGMIGSVYGTEALNGFNYYASLTMDNGFTYRIVLQICVMILFVMFVNLRMNDTKNEDAVEETLLTNTEYGKIDAVPLSILMIITGLFFSVGFIDWSANFGITIFEEFHTWLFAIELNETLIFELILGASSSSSVIGAFTIFDGITVLMIMCIIIPLAYKVKLSEVINSVISTLKFLAKPLLVIILITTIFTVGYMTQFMASIGQYILDLTPDFNPYTSSLVAGLSSVFHNDLAFTGYVFSGFFAERYTAFYDVMSVTYTSISALVQLIIPTSPLLIGLYYTKVPYKSWIKYIALFFGCILLVVMILLTVITYLG